MNDILKPVLQLLIFVLLQALIAGTVVSFVIVSRISREKLFADYGKSRPFRMLYRGRLHLVTAMALLQVIMIVIYALTLPGISAGMVTGAYSHAIISAMVVILFTVTISVAGIASSRGDFYAFLLSYPVLPVYLIFKPFTAIFLRLVTRLFPKLSTEVSSPLFVFSDSGEEHEGFIRENGSRLVRSIVEFGEKKVREVMVPRIDIFSLESHMELDEIRKLVEETGHSRVPVFEGSVDNIIGILFVKDLVTELDEENFDLKKVVRGVYYVPESKKIDELLREFQRQKKHMAIVVDEYGGTSGIVTLEDILEEIVGEIRDEDDVEGPLIQEIAPGAFLVQARINVADLNEEIKVSLPTGEVDTLGGFLYALLGRVPLEGEVIEHRGIKFKIEYLDGQRIIDVLITLPAGSDDSGDNSRVF